MLQQAHSHYDSHAADTNAPYNKRTHIKNGYGFGSVYTSDIYTFLSISAFVRYAYYYVAKCWRAPRTCLQS